MEAFKYQPLTSSTSIRLLELQPSHAGQIPRCRLFHSDLQDKPDYIALSYEWDLVPGSRSIDVNDCLVQVRSNLVAFLEVLTLAISWPITIWADGICINQRDLKERGHQV